MSDATAADVLLVFGKGCLTKPAVIDKLLAISRKYAMPVQALHSLWFSVVNKENDLTVPSLGDLSELEELVSRYDC